MYKIPRGTILKFSDSPKVYLAESDNKLRHITKEVKSKSGKSIFNYMVTLDPSYREGYSFGSPISGDLPFDPKAKGWERNIEAPKAPEVPKVDEKPAGAGDKGAGEPTGGGNGEAMWTLYSKDGKTKSVPASQVGSYTSQGWLTSPYIPPKPKPLEENKKYKLPGSPTIYRYEGGELKAFPDEETYRVFYPNDWNIQDFEELKLSDEQSKYYGADYFKKLAGGTIGSVKDDPALMDVYKKFEKGQGAPSSQPNKTNPWLGIPAEISKNFTTREQAENYWKEQDKKDVRADVPIEGADEATTQANIANALALIDQANLPADVAELWKTIVKGYPEGMEVNPENILQAFETIKQETIDPYMRELVDIASVGIQDTLADIEAARKIEVEGEGAGAAGAIRETRADLERRGQTFSGEAERKLGQDSFYKTTYEGEVPRYNRLIASSSRQRYAQRLRDLGRAGEERLGTSRIGKFDIPGYSPISGVTGSLETTRQGVLAQALSQLVQNASARERANKNVNYSFS